VRRPPLLAASQPGHSHWLTQRIWEGEYDRRGFVPRRGWHVLDIGANIGAWSLLAARRGARVTAVEPHPETVDYLRRNTDRAPVTVLQAAVMPTGGSTRLYLGDADSRHSVLGAEQRSTARLTDSVEVPAVAFEELISRGWDLVKMDCEGIEHALLESAPAETLRRMRRLVAELHGSEREMETSERRLIAAGFATRREPLEHERLSMVYARRR
jgi:FkbM family methyltransferase